MLRDVSRPRCLPNCCDQEGNDKKSPWHDIPLSSNPGTFNLVTEIPRYTLAKMEVSPHHTCAPYLA